MISLVGVSNFCVLKGTHSWSVKFNDKFMAKLMKKKTQSVRVIFSM